MNGSVEGGQKGGRGRAEVPTADGLHYRDLAAQHLLPHLGEGEERQENGGRPLPGGLGQVQEGEQAEAELGLAGACVGQ